MDLVVVVYLIYAGVALVLTTVLANGLSKYGKAVLEEFFEGKPPLAAAVTKFLVTGFYLMTLGFSLLIFRGGEAANIWEAIELLVTRIGLLFAILGVAQLLNLALLWKLKQGNTSPTREIRLGNHRGGNHRFHQSEPPVRPTYRVPAPSAEG